jgi:translocation and assembly module TamB
VSRRRAWWIGSGALTAAVLLTIGAGVAVLRSAWFYNKVRNQIVATVETATGGRVELGAFRFHWSALRAEVSGFTLHGKEPAGKPPLFHAAAVRVGLKIISVLERKVDIRYLEVEEPRVYLIIASDGSTNVPEPKVKSKGNTIDDILNLAIGRFSLVRGVFEVESRGATPFDAQGRNLAAQFGYERAGPRYRGIISVDPLDLRIKNDIQAPIRVELALALERNRVAVTSAKIGTGATSVELSGSLDDLKAPRASFQYDARVSLADASRLLRVPEIRAGEVRLGGSGTWSAAAGLAATGNLRASAVHYQDNAITLRSGRLEGALTAGPEGVDVRGVRIGATYFSSRGQAPAEGRMAEIAIRRGVMELRDVALTALDGSFAGQGRLRDWKFYTIAGAVAGFSARKIVALYSPDPLPWDGLGSGPIQIDGMLGNDKELRVSGNLAISPAAGSDPVHGQLHADFSGATGIVQVGQSTLTLRSTRAEFSGQYNRVLTAHVETTDIDDLLPILGPRTEELPVKLLRGRAIFDGTVTGPIGAPRLDGRLTGKSFAIDGNPVDSLDADVTASPVTAQLRNATAARGGVRARFDLQAALKEWKYDDDSRIFGNAHFENAPVTEALAILGSPSFPATGTLTLAGQFSGTVGRPIVKGDLTILKGSMRAEPFDRLTAAVGYSNNTFEVTGGKVVAGANQLDADASFRHAPGKLDTGRLTFRAATSTLPLETIATIQDARPGAKGSVQLTAGGELDIAEAVRIASLHADVTARNLQLTGQPLGDAHFTADSEGKVLRTKLDANLAGSVVRGEGAWRLEGDYPGSGNVAFSRLDFAQLRGWIAPANNGPDRFTGFAEGEMKIEGPALKPEALRAELRLPRLEIGPTPAAGLPPGLELKNSGPVVADIVNNTLTVQSAHLTGRSTDITLSGRVLFASERSPLDLRVAGKIDLGILRDFNPDFVSSGALAGDAVLRGKLDAPLITGRVQVQNAALNVVDFPNGLSNANGTILFSGDRATIEKLTGETGGGKVELSGFLSFQGDQAIFQLDAAARQVRVRYPEGVSTVANADLRLAGSSERSTVTGTITVLRTGFNPQSDFSSVIAKSAEPVRTPPARTGLLGGVSFDVQIDTAPDIQFQSTLTQDLQVEANLRLRGTPSSPALLGRVNIIQGQMVFFGTRYNISQGSVAFYNPLKIDPIFDIDLETKARGIDVTLTVSGPLNKLNLTPRSDPPLQFNEIVALLATGRTPTTGYAEFTQQTSAPQAWQQMGASALLGQAIASPVAGRLQRFFGVSKLRIDPTLPGAEGSTQGRVTIEQQITRDVTVTYISSLTTINGQAVRLEWAVNKQWSVVVVHEENGVASVDFLFKKRF